MSKKKRKPKKNNNKKYPKFLILINCFIVLEIIIGLIKTNNYDKAIECKRIKGDWCKKYELENMEEK